MADLDELKELINAKNKPGKFTTIASWIAVTLLPMILLAGWQLQALVGDNNTAQQTKNQQLEDANMAAFHQIYENEAANTAQWRSISANSALSQGNNQAMHMLQLFTVGETIDVDALRDAVTAIEVLHESGLTPDEIKTALKTLNTIKGLNPFRGKPAPKVSPAPTVKPPSKLKPSISELLIRERDRRNTAQQQQIQRPQPTLVPPEQLQRYIDAAKGKVKK